MDYSSLISTQFDPHQAFLSGAVDLVQHMKPLHPVHLFNRKTLIRNAKDFQNQFSGSVMFAVKSNPEEEVIRALTQGGIMRFDVASIDEIRTVRRVCPDAILHFMHTVKSREAIREAYFDHGVRIFVVDTIDELHKIVHETLLATDLTIFVRLALPKNKESAVDFSVKFGATSKGAAFLLHESRLVARTLGLMFHPGTQSTNPESFVRGIQESAEVIRRSGVRVDALDLGGGFPAYYPGQDIPPLSRYMELISAAIIDNGLSGLELFCEPGRALVADAGLLVTRIEQRKDKSLYLNDGVYGGLVEAAKWQGALRYPVSLFPRHPELVPDHSTMLPFRFFGPTCDSLDMMKGPFLLPAHASEGDWVAIGMTGAYSQCCRTGFNGFGLNRVMMVDF